MTTAVTGGAGYIGAHVVEALRGDVVIVDDLSTGHLDRLPAVPVLQADLAAPGSAERLAGFLREHGVDSVVHLAARKQVGESVAEPLWYYRQNVDGVATVLEAMTLASVRDIVFSSSAAVYGDATGAAIEESAPTRPVNPYGETKLVGEWMVRSAALAYGLRAVCLRYFNVAGAARPQLADRVAANLVPMVFERVAAGRAPAVFGADYPTADGSCVRDFVHVVDLAEAHSATLAALAASDEPFRVFNVGTGTGTSVLEMVRLVEDVTGIRIDPEILPRRAGDPAEVVASPERIAAEIGWRARLGVRDMVESAWAGYRELSRG
jgi:UDP-glucose 4-epimerase